MGLPDFSRSAALGFQTGSQQTGGNTLANVIRELNTAMKERLLMREKAAIEQGSPLYRAQVGAYNSLSAQRAEPSTQEQAFYAASEGRPYKQLSMEETKKGAGLYINPLDTALANSIGGVEEQPPENVVLGIMRAKGLNRMQALELLKSRVGQ